MKRCFRAKSLAWGTSKVCALLLWLATPAQAQWVGVDPAFPAGSGPDNLVQAVALQADGGVLIGGLFTSVSGVPQPYFARLNTNGTVDVSFAPSLDAGPTRIQTLPDGRILISGYFTSVDGVARPGLARLLANGALDTAFVPPPAPGSGLSLDGVAAPDGSVYVTGTFTNLGGVPGNNLARLLDDGSVDPGFHSPFAPTNYVSVVAVLPDGKPLVAGSFSNLNGVAVTNLVRLNLDGSVDASFQSGLAPNERIFPWALLLPDGDLVALVSAVPAYGFTAHPQRLVRLRPSGALDSRFNVTFEFFPSPFFASGVYSLALEADNRILVGGNFLDVNGTPRGSIARLEPDGTLDYCYDVALGSELWPLALAASPDGSVVVGGSFAGLQGQRHPNLLRLLPPTNCAPGVIQMSVPTLTTRKDEARVVVPVVRHGGADLEQTVAFSTRDGTARSGVDYDAVSGTLHFARGERSQFISIPLRHPATAEGADTFRVMLDQAGGGASLGALTNTAVLLTDFPPGTAGAPDTNYVVQLDGPVQVILPLPGGRAVIAGAFTNVDGQLCPGLARLQADGTRDAGFARAVPLDGRVLSLALDAQGRLLAAGYFQHVDGVWRPGLARFESDGSLDATFAPLADWPNKSYGGFTMAAVAVLADGSIVCGGDVDSGVSSGDLTSPRVLLKFSSRGELDQAFTNQMSASAAVVSLAALPDGDFYVRGSGLGSSLVRLHEDGTIDFGFIPPADRPSAYYYGLGGLLPDGRVTLANNPPTTVPNQPPIWRLNPDGSLDPGFSPPDSFGTRGPLRSVDLLSASPDGQVLIAGTFSNADTSTPTLARLHADGSWDLSFNPGTGLQPRASTGYASLNSLEALSSGGWLAGGNFGSYDGFNQPYLVKILPETLSQPLTFQFTETGLTVWETNGTVNLEVRRTGDASTSASVTVRTEDDTAIAGVNYEPIDTTLTFAPGEWSKTVTLRILDDRIADGLRQFAVVLADPSDGYTLAQPSVVEVGIQNNDTGVEFTADQFHAVEEDGFAMAAVKWTGLISTDLQAVVKIEPSRGRHVSGLEVTSVTLPCRAGTNWFRIPIVDDARHEPTRTYQLELRGSGLVIPGPRSSAELVLDDLDYPGSPSRGVAGVVEAMANSPQGGVYLAGDFTGVNGVPLNREARLRADGRVDRGFHPGAGPNADVTAIAVQPQDGEVLIAGDFTAVDGVPRPGLARLRTNGQLDTSFDPGLGASSTNGPSGIRVLLPQSDGSVYVAGEFTHFDGHYSCGIVKLTEDGSVDDTFLSPFSPGQPFILRPGLPVSPFPVPGPGISISGIAALVQQPDGKLVAAGSRPIYPFIYPFPTTAVAAGWLARFAPDGQLDTTFGTNSETLTARPIESLALTPEGEILAAASSATGAGWLGLPTPWIDWVLIQRFTTNGLADPGFQVRDIPAVAYDESQVRQVLIQPDSRILFSAVIFTNKNTRFPPSSPLPDRAIVGRLLPDGTWDSSFQMLTCDLALLREQPGPFWFNNQPPLPPQSLQPVPTVSLARQPDGVLVLAGAFDSVNGAPRRRLARVDPDGSLRGQLILRVHPGRPPRLLLPAEVQSPYVIQTSTDLRHWSDWFRDVDPWSLLAVPLSPGQAAGFFRARPVRQDESFNGPLAEKGRALMLKDRAWPSGPPGPAPGDQ